MEHQLWKAIIAVLFTLGKPRKRRTNDFTDHDIVQIYYWAVLHDRPVCWACNPKHWPIHRCRFPLPVPGTMSKRLRSAGVVALLEALERRVIAPKEPGLFWNIDGKPLVIGGCSKDRQAGYGRAAGGKAKGYKIHAIVGSCGAIACWRLAPMNVDERVMAERMLKTASIQGYITGDSNFDSNKLHEMCASRGQLQLVTRRRCGPGHGLGHRKHSVGRLRSIQLTEKPFAGFADGLLRDRENIERRFGQLSNWGGGLTCLPPWVRGYRRVRRWVQAKLILTALKRITGTTTCAA
jgi:Transposase DDE domain